MKIAKITTVCLACLSIGLLASLTQAEYATGFESPEFEAGLPLDGQGGYTLIDHPSFPLSMGVHTYLGNPLGLPFNPSGSAQFVGAVGDPDEAGARRIDETMFGDGTGDWVVSFDVAIDFVGNLPAQSDAGVFRTAVRPTSFTNPTVKEFTFYPTWPDPDTAEAWNASFVAYRADGSFMYPFAVPDDNFRNLAAGEWYRLSTYFSFDTNQITGVEITDLETGESHFAVPDGWYLAGGANSTLPAPDAFEFNTYSVGGVFALDNITITPEPTSLGLLALGAGVVLRRRR